MSETVPLLVLKSGSSYFKVIEESRFEACPMAKASVFPMDKVNRVASHLKELQQEYPDAYVSLLTITEKPYNMEG